MPSIARAPQGRLRERTCDCRDHRICAPAAVRTSVVDVSLKVSMRGLKHMLKQLLLLLLCHRLAP